METSTILFKATPEEKREQHCEYIKQYNKERKQTVDKELMRLNDKIDLLFEKFDKDVIFKDELMDSKEKVCLTAEDLIKMIKHLNQVAKIKITKLLPHLSQFEQGVYTAKSPDEKLIYCLSK
jgi:hypothetical protein